MTVVNLGEDEDDGEEKEDPAESGHQVNPPGIKTVKLAVIVFLSNIENRRDQLGEATGSS